MYNTSANGVNPTMVTQTTPARRVRIGIDVGGTFTHAVAVDTATFALIATCKVPTTHGGKEGVASGIVESLFKLLEQGAITADEIVMIAHSTTQATNALLEGDVATVGIVGMAAGLGRGRARSQTRIGNIELAPGRFLKTYHRFLDVNRGLTEADIATAVTALQEEGAQVIVASAAFSVEDPVYENQVADWCRAQGILVTSGSEISQLYGLKARTRTAVINASMLPKMLETANKTESSVKDAGITSPLMIMRSDGGIMDIAQMRKRPILTMLSGPAAGVAAALMYARISDGIFLEVGGTSTDISAIRNGKSLVKSATVGGHRLYLRTLDVRTLGVAGGSIPRIAAGKVIAAGPRSAHIANVHYSVFEDVETEGLNSQRINVETFEPKAGDPTDYVRMSLPDHEPFSVTPTCASNLLGLVRTEDTSYGNAESAHSAFAALASHLQRPDVQDVATEMMTRATDSVVQTVEDMIEDYDLDRNLLTLSGGGGGAAAIVPFTANRMNLPYEIVENAAVISAIGAALALVQDTIERTIMAPTEADVLKIRKEAEDAVIAMGADPATIEVQIEIDAQKNIVRATASGNTELRARDLSSAALEESAISDLARRSVREQIVTWECEGQAGRLYIYRADTTRKLLAGLWTIHRRQYRVVDVEGIVRLQLSNGVSLHGTRRTVLAGLKDFFEKHTQYGDAGREHPDLFVIFRGRIADMSGLINIDQIVSLLQVEMGGVGDEETVCCLLKV